MGMAYCFLQREPGLLCSEPHARNHHYVFFADVRTLLDLLLHYRVILRRVIHCLHYVHHRSVQVVVELYQRPLRSVHRVTHVHQLTHELSRALLLLLLLLLLQQFVLVQLGTPEL